MDEQTPVEATPVAEVPVATDVYAGSVKVTPVQLENGLVEVVLDSELDVRLKMTPDQWETVKSDKPYPDGDVSLRKWNKTIASVITLLAQDNAELNDTPFILDRAADRIDGALKSVVAKTFGVKEKENITIKAIFEEVIKS
jgi:hypothetical protein